jgi:hypothetical protein
MTVVPNMMEPKRIAPRSLFSPTTCVISSAENLDTTKYVRTRRRKTPSVVRVVRVVTFGTMG